MLGWAQAAQAVTTCNGRVLEVGVTPWGEVFATVEGIGERGYCYSVTAMSTNFGADYGVRSIPVEGCKNICSVLLSASAAGRAVTLRFGQNGIVCNTNSGQASWFAIFPYYVGLTAQ